jgi:hypothetical protein
VLIDAPKSCEPVWTSLDAKSSSARALHAKGRGTKDAGIPRIFGGRAGARGAARPGCGRSTGLFHALRRPQDDEDIRWCTDSRNEHRRSTSLKFTAGDHEAFVDAFYEIGPDRANKVVILTGAGGQWMPDIDFQSFGNVADPDGLGPNPRRWHTDA